MSVIHMLGASVLAALLTLRPLAASAATYILDKNDGAVYDGIIDGVPFGPSFDGTADQTGQALSVALKSGTTELRTVIEFPLASLTGITADDVVSATLVFNIDDVLGAFGPPPFTFDGTAAQAIGAWAYAGNGTVALSDFAAASGPATATAITGPDGSISDASLSSSGPLIFQLDLTAALQTRLSDASTHLGVTLATTDNNSATSIDNLGFSSAGPYDVNGTFLPYLTVVVAEDLPPTYSSLELGCQNQIGAQAQKLAATANKLVVGCFRRMLKDIAAGDGSAEAADYCISLLSADADSKLSRATAKARAKILDKCVAVASPASIDAHCNSTTTFESLASCVLDNAVTGVQQSLRASYGDACAIITAVGLDEQFPTLCLVP